MANTLVTWSWFDHATHAPQSKSCNYHVHVGGYITFAIHLIISPLSGIDCSSGCCVCATSMTNYVACSFLHIPTFCTKKPLLLYHCWDRSMCTCAWIIRHSEIQKYAAPTTIYRSTQEPTQPATLSYGGNSACSPHVTRGIQTRQSKAKYMYMYISQPDEWVFCG